VKRIWLGSFTARCFQLRFSVRPHAARRVHLVQLEASVSTVDALVPEANQVALAGDTGSAGATYARRDNQRRCGRSRDRDLTTTRSRRGERSRP
jgi:hypothetical protein